MAHLLMLHGHPVGYLPPTMASEILYDNNNTVKQKIDEIEDGIESAQNDAMEILATSSGSKTHAQHIATIKAVYDTLSEKQKTKCKLKRNNMVYPCVDTNNGRFSLAMIDSQKVYIEYIRISDTTFSIISGTSYQDLSNTTANQTYTLFI